jgi:hypothetical protein
MGLSFHYEIGHRLVKKPATKARKGINPFTKGANNIQGEAGSEDHQGSAGKGRQGHGIVASRWSVTASVVRWTTLRTAE